MSHEAHDGEDDKAGKHAGAGVDAADNDGVPEEQEGQEVREDNYRTVGGEGWNL